MPRVTPDSVLQKAIQAAVLDRESLADAYSNEGEWADEAKCEATQMQALRGKRLKNMSEDELKTAFKVFVYAEQWERSLSDAEGPSVYGKKALAEANTFRDVRLAIMGRSAFEAAMADATPVAVFPPRPKSP